MFVFKLLQLRQCQTSPKLKDLSRESGLQEKTVFAFTLSEIFVSLLYEKKSSRQRLERKNKKTAVIWKTLERQEESSGSEDEQQSDSNSDSEFV
ncbi:unnamed protein product, partial [Allacma fusca]